VDDGGVVEMIGGGSFVVLGAEAGKRCSGALEVVVDDDGGSRGGG
jgi:hypothetical protein